MNSENMLTGQNNAVIDHLFARLQESEPNMMDQNMTTSITTMVASRAKRQQRTNRLIMWGFASVGSLIVLLMFPFQLLQLGTSTIVINLFTMSIALSSLTVMSYWAWWTVEKQ